MNGREKTAFEGLFNMEVSKKYGPISVATMINLAYSTDCCHVINATTDEQLGRFYAENDFIPALEKVPDSIFEYLDFEMLGRKARFEEGGVFASGGYVTQHTELKQVYDSLALIPEVPEYGIRLLAGGPPMDSDGLPEKQVYLNLPATQEALDHVLKFLAGVCIQMYGFMFLVGLITLITEWNNIHCKTGKKILSLFTFPLFMITYIPISIHAIFAKVGWSPIQHSINRTAEQIRRAA